MAAQVHVRPAAGARVRLPARGYRLLADAGEGVEADAFIRRRIADGDVIVCDPPTAAGVAADEAETPMTAASGAELFTPTDSVTAPKGRGKREG